MSFVKKKGFQLLFVPASSTGLLQRLDTSAFSAFKHWVKRKKPAAAVNRSSLSFCGNWVKLLENFSPADNGPTLSEALGAGKM